MLVLKYAYFYNVILQVLFLPTLNLVTRFYI